MTFEIDATDLVPTPPQKLTPAEMDAAVATQQQGYMERQRRGSAYDAGIVELPSHEMYFNRGRGGIR